MPVRVVVDEPAGRVAVGSFHGDVVHVGAAVRDFDDLVLPLLFLEPLALVHVVGQRLLLSRETEADFSQESSR